MFLSIGFKGAVAQLVKAPALDAGGHEFYSRTRLTKNLSTMGPCGLRTVLSI